MFGIHQQTAVGRGELCGNGKYQRLHQIGKGHFGRVFQAVRLSDGQACVLKQPVPPGQQHVGIPSRGPPTDPVVAARQAKNEERVLRRLRHPNVLCMLDSFTEGGVVVVAVELCSGGDLHKYLGRLSQPVASAVFRDVLRAVEYLHSQSCCHCDIKSANVLLTDAPPNGTAKLADFGLATFTTERASCGDLYCPCAAPETITAVQRGPQTPGMLNAPATNANDVWALGCLVYEVCTGRHAFKTMPDTQAGRIPFDAGGLWCGNLVLSMWQMQPSARPSAAELLRAFEKPDGSAGAPAPTAHNPSRLMSGGHSHVGSLGMGHYMMDPAADLLGMRAELRGNAADLRLARDIGGEFIPRSLLSPPQQKQPELRRPDPRLAAGGAQAQTFHLSKGPGGKLGVLFEGCKITRVSNGGAAEKAGLRAGMIIVAVDGRNVADDSDAVANAMRGAPSPFTVSAIPAQQRTSAANKPPVMGATESRRVAPASVKQPRITDRRRSSGETFAVDMPSRA